MIRSTLIVPSVLEGKNCLILMAFEELNYVGQAAKNDSDLDDIYFISLNHANDAYTTHQNNTVVTFLFGFKRLQHRCNTFSCMSS